VDRVALTASAHGDVAEWPAAAVLEAVGNIHR
jgi:hypothetical protein